MAQSGALSPGIIFTDRGGTSRKEGKVGAISVRGITWARRECWRLRWWNYEAKPSLAPSMRAQVQLGHEIKSYSLFNFS
jgi:hypothetical protein